MAATKTLAAAVRSGTGKGAARSVRRAGRVPGVIYGGGEAAEPISLDYRETQKLIYAGHFLTTIFELDIEGRKERVIPRDYQLDVVKDTPRPCRFPAAAQRARSSASRSPFTSINRESGARHQARRHAEHRAPHGRDAGPGRQHPGQPSPATSPASTSTIRCTSRPSRCRPGCQPIERDRDFTVATIARSDAASPRPWPTKPLRPKPPPPRRRRQAARARLPRRPPPPSSSNPSKRPRRSAAARPRRPTARQGLRAGPRCNDGCRSSPCCSSSGWAIPAPNMPETGTTSASWRSTLWPARMGSARSGRGLAASRPKARSAASAPCC